MSYEMQFTAKFLQEKPASDSLRIYLVNHDKVIKDDSFTHYPQDKEITSALLQDSALFKGKFGETELLSFLDSGKTKKILALGIGKEEELTSNKAEELGGLLHKKLSGMKIDSAIVFVPSSLEKIDTSFLSSLMASGALLASYRFHKYFTKKTESEKFITSTIEFTTQEADKAQELYTELSAIASGVFLARYVVSEVPNKLYPESYAEIIVNDLEACGIDVNVLGEREMRELGMGALLGVGQGSINESKMVIMKYDGAGSSDKPLCFVGKGVTFDTGGISIKPAANMHEMKYDMGGSASVVGLMKALAMRGAKVNAVGIVGLVENMPGGNAQRPGDVVHTYSGQTVEVLNTDAEGRLVLCDCLAYLQDKFSPEMVIDLATLTGAIVIALGYSYAGCFSNDDDLANKLLDSGKKTGEKVWRMPLDKDFDDMINSTVADIGNLGNERGIAGSSTAAHFLQRFIKEGVKWAHLDIAGVAWDKTGKNPFCSPGASGFGVRLLNHLVKNYYEPK